MVLLSPGVLAYYSAVAFVHAIFFDPCNVVIWTSGKTVIMMLTMTMINYEYDEKWVMMMRAILLWLRCDYDKDVDEDHDENPVSDASYGGGSCWL